MFSDWPPRRGASRLIYYILTNLTKQPWAYSSSIIVIRSAPPSDRDSYPASGIFSTYTLRLLERAVAYTDISFDKFRYNGRSSKRSTRTLLSTSRICQSLKLKPPPGDVFAIASLTFHYTLHELSHLTALVTIFLEQWPCFQCAGVHSPAITMRGVLFASVSMLGGFQPQTKLFKIVWLDSYRYSPIVISALNLAAFFVCIPDFRKWSISPVVQLRASVKCWLSF